MSPGHGLCIWDNTPWRSQSFSLRGPGRLGCRLSRRPQSPHRYLAAACISMGCRCPVPTHVKEVCVSPFCFLSKPRDFPTLLRLPPQPTPRGLHAPSSLSSDSECGKGTAFSEHFLGPWRSASGHGLHERSETCAIGLDILLCTRGGSAA